MTTVIHSPRQLLSARTWIQKVVGLVPTFSGTKKVIHMRDHARDQHHKTNNKQGRDQAGTNGDQVPGQMGTRGGPYKGTTLGPAPTRPPRT